MLIFIIRDILKLQKNLYDPIFVSLTFFHDYIISDKYFLLIKSLSITSTTTNYLIIFKLKKKEKNDADFFLISKNHKNKK